MTSFSVTNAAQLQTALSQAVGGDRILLAAGDYGSVKIQYRTYGSPVTIQSAKLSDRAHFDGLFVQKSSNLTFSGLDLGRELTATESTKSTHLNTVGDSSNIRFTGVHFHGSTDDNPTNDGSGLTVSRVTNLRIDYSTFSDLYRGVNLAKATGVTLYSNTFDNLRSDGVTVAAVDKLLIDRNSFTDFRPIIGDHADAIQFWNTGQIKGSSGVTIRNNVIAPGGDDYAVQGIFMADPLTYGYSNVKIANNLIYTHGAYHGINVEGGTGLQITDNTVVSRTGDKEKAWIRVGTSSKVLLQDNVTDDLLLSNVTGVTQSNNRELLSDPSFAALIPNLDTPDTLMDLIVPGIGFQAPTSSAALKTLTAPATDFHGDVTILGSALALNSFVALP